MTERRIQQLEAKLQSIQNQLASVTNSSGVATSSNPVKPGTTYTEILTSPAVIDQTTTTSGSVVSVDLSPYLPSNAVRVRLTGYVCLGISNHPVVFTVGSIKCYLFSTTVSDPDFYAIGYYNSSTVSYSVGNASVAPAYGSYSSFTVDVPCPGLAVAWQIVLRDNTGTLEPGYSLSDMVCHIAGYWT